jgi:hypothetical protein
VASGTACLASWSGASCQVTEQPAALRGVNVARVWIWMQLVSVGNRVDIRPSFLAAVDLGSIALRCLPVAMSVAAETNASSTGQVRGCLQTIATIPNATLYKGSKHEPGSILAWYFRGCVSTTAGGLGFLMYLGLTVSNDAPLQCRLVPHNTSQGTQGVLGQNCGYCSSGGGTVCTRVL